MITDRAAVVAMLENAGFTIEWTTAYSIRILCDGGWVTFQFVDDGRLYNIVTELA